MIRRKLTPRKETGQRDGAAGTGCPLKSGSLGVILALLGDLKPIAFSPGFSYKASTQNL